MAADAIIDLILATEAVLILVLMAFNAYFLANRRILHRIREIYFINSGLFRQSWYLVISATTFFLGIQVMSLIARTGLVVPPTIATNTATIFQLCFGTLIVVAFGMVFRVFVRYFRTLSAPESEVDARILEDMRRAMVHDDTRLNLRLDLSRAGDVMTGRRHLGPHVSLAHYRAMSLGFATYMQEKLGHVGDAVLYSVGRHTAKGVAADVFRDAGSEAVALPRIFAEIQNQGIGIPEIAQRTKDRIDVVLQEGATAAGVQPVGEPLCHYHAGMFAGVFEALTGRGSLCRETKCWGLGDRFCEFRVDLDPQSKT